MAATVVAGSVGLVFCILAAYLVVLAIAAGMPARRRPSTTALPRTVVLVPAHNEAPLIGRCLASLASECGPDLRLVVVADNCDDGTAAICRSAGVEVMERNMSPRGKGHAIRWAVEQLLDEQAPQPPDALVVVDADSVVEPGAIKRLVARLTNGVQAAQAEYLALPGDGPAHALAEAALLLFHRVRLGGLARLGLPVPLVGNGMAFRADLLRRHPWEAVTAVEDLEYALQLRLGRISVAYVPDAVVRAPIAAGRAATGQRARWEGGRFHLVRTYLPKLLGQAAVSRDALCLAAALDLAVPPLGLLVTAALAGLGISLGASALGWMPVEIAYLWMLAACLAILYVPIGLASARAPARCWWSIVGAPAFLLRKLFIYARVLRGFDVRRWDRDHRQSERVQDRRLVAGIPIDPVTMAQALDRIDSAIEEGGPFQVCTVNLDFLKNARCSAEIRDVLVRSSLSLPDGAPVLWLSRLAGRPAPERVAGSDLVPLLIQRLGARGSSLFLLGGENGTAAEVARLIGREHPRLRVGWLEPQAAPLESMDTAAITQAVSAFRPDVLLVALGHPKQELFIARHVERLGARVAIGVGCSLDLMAGRRRRAPLWMQRSGLEWAYRVGAEPRRLARRYLVDSFYLGAFALNSLRSRSAAD